MGHLVRAYVAALVVAATFVGCSPLGGKDVPLMNEICNTTKYPSKMLTTEAELNTLAIELNNTNIECDGQIKLATDDLNNLISEHRMDVCSQESANDIAGYYRTHLAARNETNNSLVGFPKALKKFYISYGLRVSSFCRRQMAHRLVEDTQKLLEPADFREVAEFTGQRRYIAMFMGDPSEQSNHRHLAFPRNFLKMMNSFKSFNVTNQNKLFLQLSTTTRVHRMQAVCDRRFRPIYKQLILPLVTLAEVGFNYKGEDRLKPEPNVIKQVYEWYRIVFLCEAMNKVEFFQTPEEREKGIESNRHQVRILSKEEADPLRGDEYAIIDREEIDFNLINYRPDLKSMLPLDGLIYDGHDSELKKAIMKFRRRTRNENDPDMARRMVRFLEDQINRKTIKIVGKLAGIKGISDDGQLTGVDMVKLLDEYQYALETGKSKAISFISSRTIKYIYCGIVVVMIITIILVGIFAPG